MNSYNSAPARTVVAWLENLASTRPDAPVFRVREDSNWHDIYWQDFTRRARHAGLAALAKDFKRGEVGCILSSTSLEWLAADMGMMGIGMISAGIYPTEPAVKVAALVNDCDAALLFVDNESQLEKGLEILPSCPSLRKIVVFDSEVAKQHRTNPAVDSFADWMDQGAQTEAEAPDLWADNIAGTAAEDIALLIYTSGTTGAPKGAMISHGAVVEQIVNGTPYFYPESGWRRPAFLPLCHVAERYYTFFGMQGGAISYFVPDPSMVGGYIGEITPNFILAVPRVYEKLYAAIVQWAGDLPKAERAEFESAMEIGRDVAKILLSGARPGPALNKNHEAALAGIIGRARKACGLNEVKLLASGGAPFPPGLLREYLALGIPMLEMYGMTETGMIATNLPASIRSGSVGLLCDFVDMEIGDDGEVKVGGPSLFSGYLNKPEETAKVLQDGWFRTGDLGAFDDSGHLRLTGRSKDIIITSGGKNIMPLKIESQLRESPYISDVVVIGDNRRFISALILIDRPSVDEFMKRCNIQCDDFATLAGHPEVISLIDKEVQHANKTLARVEQIKRFQIIPRELSPLDDEMTATLKIKRTVLIQKWSKLVDQMYSPNQES